MNVAVFKFGGGTVNSPDGYRNVAEILKLYSGKSIMVILSAMGKTTNLLEGMLASYLNGDAVTMVEQYHSLKDDHLAIASSLVQDTQNPVFAELTGWFEKLRAALTTPPTKSYDEHYDEIVGFGEYFSTSLLHHYLILNGFTNTLFDARNLIITDTTFRDAGVNWSKTQLAVQKKLFPFFQETKGRIALTQGFLGSDGAGHATTLGREGSDYTAAILAYCMRVKEMTIWKDVPGVMNADPKWFDNPEKLEELSFHEAVELAYYGASVIHPKTIKPLENANIRLQVRSFYDPMAPGTRIQNLTEWQISTPIFIRKQNQALISVSPRDFSFILEENLRQIFEVLARLQVKVNVMQNSAISFSICIDQDPLKTQPLITELQKNYEVRYNLGLDLYTIRHYTGEAIEQIVSDRTVLLEQKSRSTIHLVVQEKPLP
ncbi:MAG: aspartate kinase [Bacteroidales bacterium]|nr:aspartate kinase [Bacteroidales bacterium]